jgi:hypothetical protein
VTTEVPSSQIAQWRALKFEGLKSHRALSLGFDEGLNNKIRVILRRAYGLKNEECFRLKVLTCC